VPDNCLERKDCRVKYVVAGRVRFHVHFAGGNGRWLNRAFCFFRDLPERRFQLGALREGGQSNCAVDDYAARYNGSPKPLVWTLLLKLDGLTHY